MLHDTIKDEAEIAEALSYLCEEYPTSCKKEGGSGFFSNNRIIMVKDNYFEYYRSYSSFVENKAETIDKKHLKARVEVQKIYELNFLPTNVSKKDTISLTIPSKKIISFETTSNVNENHLTKWIFSFNFNVKEEILRRKTQNLVRRRKKTKEIVPFDEEILNEGILGVSSMKKKQPKYEKTAEEQLDEYMQKLKELKRVIELKNQSEDQEKQRERRIRENTKRIKKKMGEQEEKEVFPLYNHWKQYHRNYESANKRVYETISEQKIKAELNLLYEISTFKDTSTQIVMRYIDERLLGWEKQTIHFDDFVFYKGVWLKTGGKQINQIYLANYYLADLFYATRSFKNVKIRTPLMNFVKYKGFKVLVMANMPFSQRNEYYRVTKDHLSYDMEQYVLIQEALEFYSKVMGVKNEGKFFDKSRHLAPLGKDVRVFKLEQKYENDGFHERFFYITGIKNIFPVDYNYQIKEPHLQYFLRPQLISSFRDLMEFQTNKQYLLLTQAFQTSNINQEEKNEGDDKVYEISTIYIKEKIKQLAKKLNNLEYMIVDSYSMKQYMSAMGINSRYIGKLYQLSEIPYLEQAFSCEAVAKVIKKLYRQTLVDLLKNEKIFKRRAMSKKETQEIGPLLDQHNEIMVKNAIDYLNLVFGNDNETIQFWEIIKIKTQQLYEIPIKYPPKINPGYLLHAVLYHCEFVINFNLDIPLFETQKPFKIQNWRQFAVKSKVFDYPSLQISKIIRQITFIEDSTNFEQMKKYLFPLLKIQLLFNNYLNRQHFAVQVVLSRMNNLSTKFQKPLHKIPHHPIEIPYYFSNKSQTNFKKAADLMNFSLAKNHPLFVSLYNTYSNFFQHELLKKSSLLSAIQGLGEFHPKTTELFSKYYNEGYKVFQIKASRSKNLSSSLIISEKLLEKEKYQSCVEFAEQMIKSRQSSYFTNERQLSIFFQILSNGIFSANRCSRSSVGLKIAEQFSNLVNIYKIRDLKWHQFLFKNNLIFHLCLSKNKLYLYKLVLLALKIQEDFEQKVQDDIDGFKKPRAPPEKLKIIQGIVNQYYLFETHGNWILNILKNLQTAYRYFNFLKDLFTNYQYHIKKYDSEDFKKALGYYDLLIRCFGQRIFYDCLYEIKVDI